MKFIVTWACNQSGYSRSAAYKTYGVLLEGHGPYAGIDYKHCGVRQDFDPC